MSDRKFGTKVVEATKHSIMRTISVLCVLAVMAGLAWAVYVAFVKPNTKPNATQKYEAQVINVYYIYPNKKGFSLLSWGTWHLVSKDARDVTNPIIKTEVINATNTNK